ncbi:MAG: LysR substrate-binding domain-containing protein [Pseudomonas sp.]|uniref:LysR substrate-binding domain-containing protein n=1 Tax=Pseudomonas sp. TaxID=306 RepID=UPI003392428F
MHDLNDLYYFAKVVEHGGFTAASRLLGIPKSRLSRRIAELETRLDVRLLQRTTRKLALTDVGQRYLQHCQAMLHEAELADETVTHLTSEPRGRLRVSCPVALAHTQLPQIISDFIARYPLVRLEMLLTNQRVDLLDEAVDVALRVRGDEDQDPALIARKLHYPTQALLVAAPALVQGLRLETPDDLRQVPVLGAVEVDRQVHLAFQNDLGLRREVVLEPRLGIDDFSVRKTAALAGLGFTLLPQLLCQAELDNGSLIRLLPEWALPSAQLQAVYTHRRGMLPAVRAWIEHLSEAFRDGLPKEWR